MSDFAIGTASLLVSNILLSSYPILIKNYINDVSIVTQLIIRCIVYIFLAVPFMLINKETVSILTTLVKPKYLFISLINLIHIYTSYKGFEYLNPGIALTTFYTYPIIQMFLSEFILGTRINPMIIFNLLGSLIGVIVLNRESFYSKIKTKTVDNKILIGYIAIIIAALTEAIISVFYKKDNLKNPFTSLYTLYTPAFIILLIYLFFYGDKRNELKRIIKIDKNILKKIILFNFLIGGIGYTMRLYSVTKISMSWFSSLAFTNGISVFILAWLILGERIRWNHIIGSLIIFYNIHRIKTVMNGY
jgi:drug/metabolite transporter (DMT)-like permease